MQVKCVGVLSSCTQTHWYIKCIEGKQTQHVIDDSLNILSTKPSKRNQDKTATNITIRTLLTSKLTQLKHHSSHQNWLIVQTHIFGHWLRGRMRHVSLVGIVGTNILVSCHLVKSRQLIWRLGTRRWNLRVPNLQMNCSDLSLKIGYQGSSPSNGHQGDKPCSHK